MVHVVHLTDSASRAAGGIFASVNGLAKAQSKLGLRVSILAGHDQFTEADQASWSPLDLVSVPSQGWQNGIRGAALMAALDRLRPDFVHLHGIWGPAARALARWAPATQTPYAVSPHGMLDVWALRRSAAKKRVSAFLWEGRLLRGAAFVHALAAAEGAAVRAYGLVNPLAVVPNGIDVPTDCSPIPSAHGRNTLLFMARIHPKKGLSELLEAWAKLSPDLRGQWHLQVAGWDEIGLLGSLRAQAQALGIADAVSFPGGLHGAEKDAALRGAQAFILPSHSEGLPMAVLEAWAYGLPAFITQECNLPEGFAAGAAFRISTNPQDMAQVLEHYLPDVSARKQAGQAGRDLVAERFGWATIAASMIAHYRAALEGKGGHG